MYINKMNFLLFGKELTNAAISKRIAINLMKCMSIHQRNKIVKD